MGSITGGMSSITTSTSKEPSNLTPAFSTVHVTVDVPSPSVSPDGVPHDIMSEYPVRRSSGIGTGTILVYIVNGLVRTMSDASTTSVSKDSGSDVFCASSVAVHVMV